MIEQRDSVFDVLDAMKSPGESRGFFFMIPSTCADGQE